MTTTVRARRIPGQQVTLTTPGPEAARDAARTLRRPPGPRREWPRPQLVHDHASLFREPAYADGQPYAADDDLEDDE
ncbi:hypothetical protein ACTWJ9_33340 (plasmid) [Streptomyces sp. GDS52]|uniref:hypothetical protein n=1 Tax=Streptomyces sp. GDS52 TaxID=3406419 RepID=UPI003FD378C6